MSLYSYGLGRRRVHRRRVHRRRGGNIFSDIAHGLMKGHDFIRKHKIISGVSGALSLIPGPVGNVAKIINTGSSALGYGRRRRVYRKRKSLTLRSLLSRAIRHRGVGRRRAYRKRVYRRRGGNVRSTLTGIHNLVKEKRLLSSALKHFLPHNPLHNVVHLAGYGRGRRRRSYGVRRRRHMGGAFFPFTTEQIAVPKFS